MIILATGDERLRERWWQGLSGLGPLRDAASLEALERGLEERPTDLVLLHRNLPGLDGALGAAEFKRRHPQLPILYMADTPDGDEGIALLGAHIQGYANAYMAPALLTTAAKVVLAGEVWAGATILRRLIQNASHPDRHHRVEVINRRLDDLTEREKAVALMVAEGAHNKQIASRFDITERTVKAHLTAIFRKTATHDRLQLALLINGPSE